MWVGTTCSWSPSMFADSLGGMEPNLSRITPKSTQHCSWSSATSIDCKSMWIRYLQWNPIAHHQHISKNTNHIRYHSELYKKVKNLWRKPNNPQEPVKDFFWWSEELLEPKNNCVNWLFVYFTWAVEIFFSFICRKLNSVRLDSRDAGMRICLSHRQVLVTTARLSMTVTIAARLANKWHLCRGWHAPWIS